MASFVLIPGAGGAGHVYWRLVVEELEGRGHWARSVEIQGDDPALGLPEYAAITDRVVAGAVTDDLGDVVVVAQSMGGFTVPMLDRLDVVTRIVLVNAMIPRPGETPGGWFETTGANVAAAAAADDAGRPGSFDAGEVFLHDIPREHWPEMEQGDREPAGTPFGQPCEFGAWPDVPTEVIVGADDRLFPADFQVRQARERLGLTAKVISGGHLVARSNPVGLCDAILEFTRQGDV